MTDAQLLDLCRSRQGWVSPSLYLRLCCPRRYPLSPALKRLERAGHLRPVAGWRSWSTDPVYEVVQ